MPTKIEQSLTPEQVEALCSQLFATPGGTLLKSIQQAAARFGVQVSLMGASAFRDGKLSDYLASLRAKTERAQQIAALQSEGASLGDAAAVRLSETILDDLLNGDPSALTTDEKNTYALMISRLRLGDQRAALLETRLREAERKQTEWDEQRAALRTSLEKAKSKSGLTQETRELIEQQLALL